MSSFLNEPPTEITVPPAGLVYWRAEIRSRQERAEAALRPMRHMGVAAAAVISVASCVIAVVNGPPVLAAGSIFFAATIGGAMWMAKRLLNGSQTHR